MTDPHRSRLTDTVAAGRYAEAEAHCVEMLGQQADWAFWKTQLGYVCFLNEQDDAARFVRAPRHFAELVTQRPLDGNALFWKAYLDHILLDNRELAADELRQVLRRSPDHPYAPLVLAGMSEDGEAVRLLESALHGTPNNFRALGQLGRLLHQRGRREDARAAYGTMLEGEPFVEARLGIMNPYANEVLTAAAHADAYRDEARRYLLADGALP
jgi:tetratricopeptide (TPR) repeat protein